MEEYTTNEEEVHLEPQIETNPVAEPVVQGEEQNPAKKEGSRKELIKLELSKLKN